MQLVADLLLILFFVGVLSSPAALPYLCVNPALGQYIADTASGTSFQFGGQEVSFQIVGGGSATFVVEAGSITFDSEWEVLKNGSGNPSKQKGQQTIPEAELTIQYIGGATLRAPKIFGEFNLICADGNSYTFIVARIVHNFTNDGSANKATLGVRYKLN